MGAENNEDDEFSFIYEEDENKKIIRSTIGNKKMWNYFLYLTEDKKFKDYIEIIRKKYLDKDNKIKELKKFKKEISKLSRGYGLDEIAWSKSLNNYIVKNEIPKENLSMPCIALDRVQIGEDEQPAELYENVPLENWPSDLVELKPVSYSHPVIIRITPYASQREIIDYIKKTYRLEIEPIQKVFRDKNVLMGKQRTKNPKIKERNSFIIANKAKNTKRIKALLKKEGFGVIETSLIDKVIQLEKKENK
ncbi:MAG: hypothetical protein V4504_01120 [Patescibacteria group bacterium]